MFDKDKDEGKTVKASPTDDNATDPVVEGPPVQSDPSQLSAEEFADQQRALAQSQNLTAPNAVPERRPQAFLEGPPDNELTKRLREEGVINDKPMGHEAYVRAASDEQMDKSAEVSQSEAVHPGSVVRVTEGPHRDRFVAVTRVEEYQNQADLVNVAAGRPEQRFAHPSRIEGSARGDERDGEVLILDQENGDDWEVVRDFTNRRMR